MLSLFLCLLFLKFGSLFAMDVNTPNVGTILSQPARWIDEQGHEIQLSQFNHRPVVLTMLYTQCRKICPNLTLGKLKEIHRLLNERHINAEFIIVTFDPENDTPDVLRSFQKRMHLDEANWHLLRGRKDDTRQMAQLLGLGNYFKMDEHIVHDFRILYGDGNSAQTRVLNRENPDVLRLIDGPPTN